MVDRAKRRILGVGIAAAFVAGLLGAWTSDQAGAQTALDTSFGKNGRVVLSTGFRPWGLPNGDYTGGATSLVVDHRGRIVVGTSDGSDPVVARFLPDGQLDPSFGENGRVDLYSPSFGFPDDKRRSSTITALSVQRDGKILAFGSVYGKLGSNFYPWMDSYRVRLNRNGTVDTSFIGGRHGMRGDSFWSQSIVPLKSGSFLVAGRRPMSSSNDNPKSMPIIAKFHRNGYSDRSFGDVKMSWEKGYAGFAPDKPAHGGFSRITTVGKGKILAAGFFEWKPLIARFLRNGRLDRSFGSRKTPGRVITPLIGKCRCAVTWGARFDFRGRIVMAGWAFPGRKAQDRLWVARFLPNGKPDSSFGHGGKVIRKIKRRVEVGDLTIQPDGKIVVTAMEGFLERSSLVLYRFDQDGSLDQDFFNGGKMVQRFGQATSALSTTLDRHGRLLIAGGVLRTGQGHILLERFRVNR